jgi:hypothetical protein
MKTIHEVKHQRQCHQHNHHPQGCLHVFHSKGLA